MWGIDSVTPISEPFLVRVSESYGGRMPEVVGRYLDVYPLTPEEVAEIRRLRVFFLPIWNGIDASVQRVQGQNAYQNGAWHAAQACQRLEALGIRHMTSVAFDLETWTVDIEWFLGASMLCRSHQYKPIWYVNTNSPYLAPVFRQLAPSLAGSIWTSEPEPPSQAHAILDTFDLRAYPNPINAYAVGRQYAESTQPDGLVDLDCWSDLLAEDLACELVPCRLPLGGGVKRLPYHGGPNLTTALPHALTAAGPEIAREGDRWIWLPDYHGWVSAQLVEYIS